jgi:hypothetical protein
MARNPTLTVNVNSQQFQQFARQFNAFSGQIRQLNQQFAQINTTINRTTISARVLQSTLQGVLNVGKSIASTMGRITGHLVKWSTIIGGVSALLGIGGGLFGIERLAASILAKRRQVLGLGGGTQYGRVQATGIYGQSYLDNPMGSLAAVQRGLGGSSEELKGLMVAGIPFGTRMPPAEVLDKIIDKTMEVVKHAAPGTELMVTKSMGLDKFLSESDIMRMTTEEGRKEILEKREMIKAHEKELTLSARAQKGWADLELQFQIAKASLETIFGEKLRDLAKPLEHLSEGFTHLIQVLMKSPAVKEVIKILADNIEWLAGKLKDITEKDVDDFIKKIKEWLPTMEQFKSAMKEFVDILQGAVNLLSYLKGWSNPLAAASQAAGSGVVHDWLDKHLTPAGKDLLKFDSGKQGATKAPDATTQAPTPQSPSTTQPPSPSPAPVPSAPPTPQSSSSTSPAPPSGSTIGGALGGIGGGGGAPGSFKGFTSPNAGFGGLGFGGGGGAQAMIDKAKGALGNLMSNPNAPSATPAPSPDAAKQMTPTPSYSPSDFPSVDRTLKGNNLMPKQGPLSMGNWQMNRTASLVIRNVPGANIFMSATGMTG